ncbi:uncharacterized protein BT62DRAFT_982073 [Guyanagaster necrorhizus]|uniref:Aip3p/Bud6 N-terminal domain-containing protein n=1 Tax=Guyanagaster necrorhizus TaxID=856835 RepID=A0A9P7VLH4_9AGAR|nr:uncharacterized protein BT62DRAFT_982073 [Guyanagaster necrorhizus MCA 3950]KAG7443356.1 hypothetical protein BT62DRAFT_982073 [Guyanagaster necrorhizus MCA 3950]
MSVYTQRVPGDVPTAVHSLLLSTKQLQESLRLWSINQATETQVSDVYVQIGTQFNTTVHAFAHHKIDLSDIHSIPTDLRTVLEQCLAEDPSPQALAVYMPEVRRVLYKLLKGLQAKQDAWKAVGGRIPMMPSESR